MDWSFLDELPQDSEPPSVTVRSVPVLDSDDVMFDRVGGTCRWHTEPMRFYDFGMVDKKGRRIGIMVFSRSTDYQSKEVGRVVTHERTYTITRNGELTNSETMYRFNTRNEAEEDVQRHIAASVKRYAKTCRRV